MTSPTRLRTPHPHLGAYFGIVTSAFVSLIVLLALFEQLGWRQAIIAEFMIVTPLVLYIAMAVGSRTLNVEDFFTSGRRVPAVFNGFVLAATAVGGVGFFAYAGTLCFLGMDALAIGLGLACGILTGAVLFVPYLRKAGAYTVPGFLGQRFRSRRLRFAASLMQLPPTALLLAAEIKIAAAIAALFLPLTFSVAVFLIAALIATIGILGGMRSLTWTGGAQFIVGAVGLVVTLVTVSVLLTSLPSPQFTFGQMIPPLQSAEITAGLSPVQPGDATADLPQSGLQALVKPFFQPFGILSRIDFIVLFFCLVLGTATLPSLLVRSGVTRSIQEQRRSMAWALLLVAVFALTAPALAVFVKLLLFQDFSLASATLPDWLSQGSGKQLLQASDADGDGRIGADEVLLARDGVALMLASLVALPYVFTVLMAAAGMAIALAAAGSHLFTLAGSIAEDVYRVLDDKAAQQPRLAAAWTAIAGAAFAAAIFLVVSDLDPLRAAITAFAFGAATFFPVLLLGIWWPRCTEWGAFTAMSAGFLVILLCEGLVGGAAGFTALASLAGVVAGLAVGIGTSLYGGKPTEADGAYWEELRDPEGEAIYDRQQQRAAAVAANANANAGAS